MGEPRWDRALPDPADDRVRITCPVCAVQGLTEDCRECSGEGEVWSHEDEGDLPEGDVDVGRALGYAEVVADQYAAGRPPARPTERYCGACPPDTLERATVGELCDACAAEPGVSDG